MSAHAGDVQPPRVVRNDFLREADTSQRISLIVLNNTLPQLTAQLWSKAGFRVCADGGANRLYDDLPRMLPGRDAAEVRRQHVPQVICGDLDSLRADVRRFYEGLGAACHDLSDDQDSTDFEKCLRVTAAEMARHQHPRGTAAAPGSSPADADAEHVLVVLGAMGGRMDHVLSHLNVLYAHPDLPIALIGDGNAVRLLRSGSTSVRVTAGEEGPYCGIVPLAGPSTVSSKGLKWDMDGLVLKFGGQLSTSNQFREEVVTIDASHPCLWITALMEK